MTDRATRFDLTSGSVIDKLIFISLPIIGTQLMQMAYNMTDMFWLGRLSSDAVAASGTAGMYLWLSAAFMLLGRMGAEIGVSQNTGRGDLSEAANYAAESLRISIVLGVGFFIVLILFRSPLIGFFNIREANVDTLSQSYLLFVSPYVPLSFVSSAITGCFNALGNSKTPFYINCVGLVLNIVLDPVLIFYFNLGVEGAAIATVAAQAVACVIFVYAIKYSKSRPFECLRILDKPSLHRVRWIFIWSAPVAVESLFFTVLSMIVSRFVAAWGSAAIAVLRVGSQIESLTWLIGEGLASAVTAYVGQNYGAGKWRRIHRGFKASIAILATWGLIVGAVLYFGAQPLISAFLREPETLQPGVSYLKIMAFSQVFMCMEFVAAGAFRGMGKTLPPSFASITANTARVLLAWYLGQTYLGLDGIWWAVSLGAIARGVWLFPWYLLYSRKLPREDGERELSVSAESAVG